MGIDMIGRDLQGTAVMDGSAWVVAPVADGIADIAQQVRIFGCRRKRTAV